MGGHHLDKEGETRSGVVMGGKEEWKCSSEEKILLFPDERRKENMDCVTGTGGGAV